MENLTITEGQALTVLYRPMAKYFDKPNWAIPFGRDAQGRQVTIYMESVDKMKENAVKDGPVVQKVNILPDVTESQDSTEYDDNVSTYSSDGDS